ncbi:DUF1269 domain-containing protein [Nocardioides sp. MAH-18]|uniref:DUF1269 domain-containing protein n=1 Tax=Nocardioides agri TaxID=2682843 RepID=A0A6L6XU21_9ACTN|nr:MULTISPECIES: DUF1269 domain-containing protein [unclassified Nocardioides]MBA2955113.1 DUF1269 domain-containing protein [Nocardioides sp. CGMCC 1.13656]MVQ49966.1 DUF1269 domain-containing protein [Nocardioides sp. MAH-18]
MPSLTVWRFDTPAGAARAAQLLDDLAGDPDFQDDQTVALHDAAVVEWDAKERRPRTWQVAAPALTGALDEGFWALLFGLVFFVPLLGAAVGAAGGAVAGSLADIGIDDRFINRVRDQVTPGSSALVVLSSRAAVDRVHAAVADVPRAELIVADLADAHLAALREVFGR